MGIWDKIFPARHIPRDFHEFSDPELGEAERSLDGVDAELNDIESVTVFFEKELEVAPRATPGTRPSYIGTPLPHYLKSELGKVRVKKERDKWVIYYFTLTDFARMRELIEHDWFYSIDDQIAAPFEAITRGLYKTKKSHKREILLRMFLRGKFKIDDRRRNDIAHYAKILGKRNDLQKRCDKIIAQIAEGKLNSLLAESIYVKNLKKGKKLLEDRYNG
ncbi:TPA: hypothetical protein H1012_04390 [archaeon]|nr:hypothetical protein [Candidatus Naiadarchaeales archaeon SRR2090159.bin1288]